MVFCASHVEKDSYILFYTKGGEDDDRCGDNLCYMLAPLSYLLHSGQLQEGYIQSALHPAGLFGHLLASYEFHHVQPHHILLSEPKVFYIHIQKSFYNHA